jgi:hypothetical protein
MLSSKDLVKRAIGFRSPKRVPYNFDSNRTPVIDERYGDDFAWVFSSPADRARQFWTMIGTKTSLA